MTFLAKHPFFLPMLSLVLALISLGVSAYNIGHRHGVEQCTAAGEP